MSFIAVSVPPAAPAVAVIENDGFFPDLDPSAARARMRIDGTVTTERLVAALTEAAASVNGQLAAWKQSRLEAGAWMLEDVQADTVGGVSILVQRYHRAVECYAAASLIERHRSFDATNDGHQYADKLESPIDDLRRDARWAISDILGVSRSTIELI
jgi:hypothetical protein